jgi:uroporphyrinogen-III synthase
MSTLIEKQGGIPVIRSLQGLLELDENSMEPELRRFASNGADWAIFTTGTGTEILLTAAEKLGIRTQFINSLEQAKVAVRGYKTYSVLKKLGILPDVADDDGTTRGLISALEPLNLKGQEVLVQLHGEPVPELIRFLEKKGAYVKQLLPYRHIAPEMKTLELLCRELDEGLVDAVCFTTAVQVRYLFNYAKQSGSLISIKRAFEQKVMAVAVGKVTAEALREEGVDRFLTPENERMGAMIIELAQFYANNQDAASELEQSGGTIE